MTSVNLSTIAIEDQPHTLLLMGHCSRPSIQDWLKIQIKLWWKRKMKKSKSQMAINICKSLLMALLRYIWKIITSLSLKIIKNSLLSSPSNSSTSRP